MTGAAIRAEAHGDAPAVHAVTAAAFRDAPHRSGTEQWIVDGLRDAGALTVSLVAEAAGTIVGHIAFSPVTIDGEPGTWFGLGPVSVAPDRQHRGIGAALIRDGLDRLRALGASGCVLLGDPAYYRRFGFVSDPALRYGDVPPGYLQRLLWSGAPPTGGVAFHPAFDVIAPEEMTRPLTDSGATAR